MAFLEQHYENIKLPSSQNFGLRHFQLPESEAVIVKPHCHDLFEIMYFKEGNGYIEIEGSRHAISKNSLVFVPSLHIHSMKLSASGIASDTKQVRFSPNQFYLFQFTSILFQQLNIDQSALKSSAHIVSDVSEEDAKRVVMMFEWLTDSLKRKTAQLSLHIISTLLSLTESQARIDRDNNKTNRSSNRLIPVFRHLEQSQSYSLSLDSAAELCGLSRYYFSRLFKEQFAENFNDYLNKRKLNQAIYLLTNSNKRIAEIAYECEFSDSAYFCAKFKKYTGQSPSEFRSHARNTHNLL